MFSVAELCISRRQQKRERERERDQSENQRERERESIRTRERSKKRVNRVWTRVLGFSRTKRGRDAKTQVF